MPRHRRRLTFANVTALVALCLAVTSPAWSEPVAQTAATTGKKLKKALSLGKKADKRSKQALSTASKAQETAGQALAKGGPPGPQGATGATGATGAQGQQGAAGSPAASMITGHTDHSLSISPATSELFFPSGFNDNAPSTGQLHQLSPNAEVVFRDLSVKIQNAPGTGNQRRFHLRAITPPPNSENRLLSACTIADAATTCNTGNTTINVPAGSDLAFISSVPGGNNPAVNSETRWGFRATTP
jgi:hypothetical protein